MSNWYLISNRLPFTYNEETGKISQSSGGLVTALNGIKGVKNLHWIGVIDEAFPKQELSKINAKSSIQFDGPRIDSESYDNYYNGFCNDVLWPLLHYETERVNFNDFYYSEYKKVNEIFANFLNKKLKKGDFVWVHDFHFFLLPKYIKEKFKDQIRIGFFLHVPFPSSEIYRQLSSRREILSNLIYADLIGFHDFSYLRHFSRTVYDILGYSTKSNEN